MARTKVRCIKHANKEMEMYITIGKVYEVEQSKVHKDCYSLIDDVGEHVENFTKDQFEELMEVDNG